MALAVVALSFVMIQGVLPVKNGELVFAMFGIGGTIVASRLRVRWFMYAAVLFLPFTHAGTFTFVFRWRISEFYAWFLLPFAFKGPRDLPGRIHWSAYLFVGSVVGYFIYTGLVGVASAPSVDTGHNPFVVNVNIHPVFRTLIESARGLGAVILVITLLRRTRDWDDWRLLIQMFVLGGVLTALYGIYQGLGTALDIHLPLIPGTALIASTRPGSTLYEPSGFGAFVAVAVALCAYLIVSHARRRRLWIFCFGILLIGLVLSLSRTGLVAAAVAYLVLAIASPSSLPRIMSTTVLVVAFVWIGVQITNSLLGSEVLGLQSANLQSRVEVLYNYYTDRAAVYLVSTPQGVGGGLYTYTESNVAGWERLMVEGGLVGLAFLFTMHLSIIRALLALWARPDLEGRRFAPYAAAAYGATVMVLTNYALVTDMWLWIAMGLPVIAASVRPIRSASPGVSRLPGVSAAPRSRS